MFAVVSGLHHTIGEVQSGNNPRLKIIKIKKHREEVIVIEMEEAYEKLRILFSPEGFVPLPKHELTDKLLRNLYSEEEATLIARCFKRFKAIVSFKEIKELTGIPDEKLQNILMNMAIRGKIRREGETDFYMNAYLPGVFEDYFTISSDDPEIMKKVAAAHRALQKIGFSPGVEFPLKKATEFSNEAGWRFMPAAEPISRTIEISEKVATEHHVLPFEVLEQYLSAYDVFSVTKCSCRNMAELAGEPCKRTAENFCVQAGPSAETMIKYGIGKELNFDEMMEVMKKAAREGLVHSTQNMQDPAAFICNCCSCCCGVLMGIKNFKYKEGKARSNFTPMINDDDCDLCETCADMCPIEVIQLGEDASGERMKIDLEFCIGCGVCAANCLQEAIALEKSSNNIPVQSLPGFFG